MQHFKSYGLEWVVISSSRGSFQPRDQTTVSHIGRQILYHLSHQGSPKKYLHVKSLQSYLTLYNPMDYSPPGFSVRRILQARILERVAMPSSRGSSQPRDATRDSCLLLWQVGSLPLEPPRKP